MEQSEMPVQPGDLLLGKYRVEQVLGQGGMGVVVAARHVDLGELFAVKFLRPKSLDVPGAVERFLREARASVRLKSEHVAKVHDVGRLENGVPYMVMEHLVGRDLKARLRERGPLPLDEATTLVLQACEAIAEAHAIGIVHRDIKPSNMFLTQRRNGSPCLKILDFGIAKEISAEGADLTRSGVMLGSPLYMSPEQMTRSKHVDARTDVWSMSVVLYELVTGKVPFYGETLTEIVGSVLQNELEMPSERCKELPAWFDDFIARGLAKNPDERFATIEDFAAALRAGGAAQSAAEGAPRRALPSATADEGEKSSENALLHAITAEAERVWIDAPSADTGADESTTLADSIWGKTDTGSRAARNTRARIMALVALGIAALGGAGAWLAQRTPAPPIVAPTPTAESTGTPTEFSSASDSSIASAALDADTTAQPAASAEPPAKASSAVPSRSTRAMPSATTHAPSAPKATARAPRAAASTKATAAPSAQAGAASSPPAPSTRPKPDYEGVF